MRAVDEFGRLEGAAHRLAVGQQVKGSGDSSNHYMGCRARVKPIDMSIAQCVTLHHPNDRRCPRAAAATKAAMLPERK